MSSTAAIINEKRYDPTAHLKTRDTRADFFSLKKTAMISQVVLSGRLTPECRPPTRYFTERVRPSYNADLVVRGVGILIKPKSG